MLTRGQCDRAMAAGCFPLGGGDAGLHGHFSVSCGNCLVLLPLAPLEARLAAGLVRFDQWCAAEELARWQHLGSGKRRLEWLGGRLAAKCAADILLRDETRVQYSWDSLVLESLASGQPVLRPPEKGCAVPLISLSHSGDYAVALAAWHHPCGVDVQQLVPALDRVRDRFCSREEDLVLAGALPDLPERERLGLLWAAKEAGKKGLTPERGGLSHLQLRGLRPQGQGWFFQLNLVASEAPGRVTLAVRLLDSHALAWIAPLEDSGMISPVPLAEGQ